MENISVVIVTDDREYGRALGLSLLSICRTFIVKIILKKNFAEILGKIQACDRILADEYDLVLWDGPEADDAYGGNLILLTEKPSMVSQNHTEKKFRIYKYDPAQIMVGNLFEIYAELTGRKPVNIRKNNVRLFNFASCAGGTGCSTLAMAVCQDLCRFHGAKVLYLSFENIESTGEFIDNVRSVNSLSRYLYLLFRENSIGNTGKRDKSSISDEIRQGSFIESYVVRDEFGVEAFAPTGGRNPLAELDDHETALFLSVLIDSGRYDAIVTDTGSSLAPSALACAEMSEKICFVTTGSVNDIREEQCLQYLIFSCGESIVKKILKIKNKTSRHKALTNCEGSGRLPMIETGVYVEKTQSIIHEGCVRKIILENDFGDKIGIITRKLTEPSC